MQRLIIPLDHCLHANASVDDIEKKIIDCIKDVPGQFKLCLLYCRESLTGGMYQPAISFISKCSDICADNPRFEDRFEIISNDSIKCFFATHTKPSNCDVTIIDNFLLVAYLSQKFNKKSNHPPLTSVNSNNKFLCKFGKIHRSHRYLMYCVMRDEDLFHDVLGDWSLFTHKDLIQEMEEAKYRASRHVIGYPDFSMDDMFQHHRTLPDIIHEDLKIVNGTFHYTGYPFAREIYENTKFSIVIETMFSVGQKMSVSNASDLLMTEKIWIPISMKHPVLLSAPPEQADILLKRGFRSADNFEFCQASNLKSYKELCDLFVKCYNKFVDTSPQELYDIADHNYGLFQKLGARYYDSINIKCPCFNIVNLNTENPNIAFTSSGQLESFLIYQYSNRDTRPYDWDWDALDNFSPDK